MSYPIRNRQNNYICSAVLVFINQAVHYNTLVGICSKFLWSCNTGSVVVPLLVLLLHVSQNVNAMFYTIFTCSLIS
jgi:hypothetical protein